MKKRILFILLITSALVSAAQKKIVVKESSENIGGGRNNALVVLIFEADEKIIEKEWRSLMKDCKAKVSSKDEIFADNALIGSISANSVDIYARVESMSDCFKLIVGFDLGGAYLSSSQHKDAYKAAEKMLYDFAVNVSKKFVENEKDAAEKDLRALVKKQDQLAREKDKLNNSIEDYKSRIEQAQKDLEANGKNNDDNKKAIDEQKLKVDAIGDKLKKIE